MFLSRTPAAQISVLRSALKKTGVRLVTRRVATSTGKREGDISDAFTQLSGREFQPLPPRFADLKGRLIAGHEDELQESWHRLLGVLREEIPLIEELGSKVVPEIDYSEIGNPSEHFKAEHKKRGVAIIRNVIPEQEALRYKSDLQSYIKANPQTKAFPQSNPQVFELYWSSSQIRARSHPNLNNAQRFLMQFWHSDDPDAKVSSAHPTAYADRLRMRLPGDAQFALGPHVDGGSVERWEEGGYGRGHVYDKIFSGNWEEYDPWESSCRLPVLSDLYQGVGACSMFRMYQGWMSMSNTGPNEGTLLVNPLLRIATSYLLLRPFFSPQQAPSASDDTTLGSPDFLSPSNWKLNRTPDSWLHGANPGTGQEAVPALHPHLRLDKSMVHVPRVRPGDYVAWHCDTIHAVDAVHAGQHDSSVMYIPACPLTELNAAYLARQRDAFVRGVPAPDFPGGVGESEHVGRPTPEDVEQVLVKGFHDGLRAFGLEPWNSAEQGLAPGQKEVMDRANKILGFYE